MPFKKLIILSAALAAAVCGNAAPGILNLSESITDTAIVYPESFETDVHKMMQNWYLQNYTVLDSKADSEADVPVTDEVIIQRLAQIPTTIEMPFNQVVKSYINMYTQKRRGLVENMLGMSLYYMPIFEEALEREGLPLELRYLPIIESALNPDAVSRAGATGLWQFMLPTARGLGMEISTLVDERRDPLVSSEAAAKYLKQLHDIYGDWSLAIASYNCGPGNVNKALRRAGVDMENPTAATDNKTKADFWSIYYNLPAETRGYVPAFIAANYVMNNYNHHNISPALAKRPIITDTIHVNKRVHFDQISDILNIPVEEIRVLNPQYRKDIIPGDVRPYALRLPSKLVYAYIMSEDSILNRNQARYGRRTVVEPTDATALSTGTRLVVKTHKVQRGETMQKIASRYGVTVSEIKKWNRLKSTKVRRGQNLKIHTYQPIPASEQKKQEEAIQQPATMATDSVVSRPADAVDAPVDSVTSQQEAGTTVEIKAEPKPQPKPAPKPTPKPKAKEQKKSTGGTVTHTVRKGESYWKIAKKYPGVSADDIRKANPTVGEKIKVGQKLKIPKK